MGGQSRLWALFLSRGDSEELTWQSLDLKSGGAWTTSPLLLCHDCFGHQLTGPNSLGPTDLDPKSGGAWTTSSLQPTLS